MRLARRTLHERDFVEIWNRKVTEFAFDDNVRSLAQSRFSHTAPRECAAFRGGEARLIEECR